MAPLSRGAALQQAFHHVPGRYVALVPGMAHEQAEKSTVALKKATIFLLKHHLNVVNYFKKWSSKNIYLPTII